MGLSWGGSALKKLVREVLLKSKYLNRDPSDVKE